MLNSTGDRGHAWRMPTLVTHQVTGFYYSALRWLGRGLLWCWIFASQLLAPDFVKHLFEVYEVVIEVLLILKMPPSHDATVKILSVFSWSEASLTFCKQFLSGGADAVQHHFALGTDKNYGSVVLTLFPSLTDQSKHSPCGQWRPVVSFCPGSSSFCPMYQTSELFNMFLRLKTIEK